MLRFLVLSLVALVVVAAFGGELGGARLGRKDGSEVSLFSFSFSPPPFSFPAHAIPLARRTDPISQCTSSADCPAGFTCDSSAGTGTGTGLCVEPTGTAATPEDSAPNSPKLGLAGTVEQIEASVPEAVDTSPGVEIGDGTGVAIAQGLDESKVETETETESTEEEEQGDLIDLPTDASEAQDDDGVSEVIVPRDETGTKIEVDATSSEQDTVDSTPEVQVNETETDPEMQTEPLDDLEERELAEIAHEFEKRATCDAYCRLARQKAVVNFPLFATFSVRSF